jgi:hypothetical protein
MAFTINGPPEISEIRRVAQDYLAIIVALLAAAFTAWQAWEAHNARKESERAWIGIQELKIPNPKLPGTVTFEIRATGNSPALQVNVAATCNSGSRYNSGLAADTHPDPNTATQIGLLVPGAVQTSACSGTLSDEAPTPMIRAHPGPGAEPKEEESNASDTLIQIVIVGRITYQDIFDRKHFTNFCYSTTRGPNNLDLTFYPCVQGNNGD